MELYFDHVLGKQKDKDFIFSLVSATFAPEEWEWAFQNGWAPIVSWFDSNFSNAHPLIWYQCRQTRIKVSEYAPNRKTKKLLKNTPATYKISNELSMDIKEIYSIYSSYCTYKDFGDILTFSDVEDYFKPIKGCTYFFIQFFYDNKPIAITKLSLWGNTLLSEVFWWDYKNPELSLGKLSFYLEIELAKQLQLDYLYTGISYNLDSMYKSDKKGFQFWTGRKWCSDTELFKYLCSQDDKIQSIDELHEYQYLYLKRLNV